METECISSQKKVLTARNFWQSDSTDCETDSADCATDSADCAQTDGAKVKTGSTGFYTGSTGFHQGKTGEWPTQPVYSTSFQILPRRATIALSKYDIRDFNEKMLFLISYCSHNQFTSIKFNQNFSY
jgi:hypothetical protein